MNYHKKAKGAARLAILSGLAAIAMNSCHSTRRAFTVNSYPGYENAFHGEWKGPYFIYGYPTEKSKNKGLLDIRIRKNGLISGKIFYNGVEGKLEGVVNDSGEFISSADFDYNAFMSFNSDLNGKISFGTFYSGYYSADMIKGKFTLFINGSSYKGDLALLPADIRPQGYYLEKILTSDALNEKFK